MNQRQNKAPGGSKSGFIPAMVHGFGILKNRLSVRHAAPTETVSVKPYALQFDEREFGETVSIINAGEAINFNTAQAFGSKLFDCISRDRHVILSMSDVTEINTAGAAVLVKAFAAARNRGLRFALVAVNQEFADILDLFRIKHFFPEYRHLADAKMQIYGIS